MNNESIVNALKGVKVPILVLDQKWHRLFAIGGKPEGVKQKEQELNELLARQGKVNQELKELKKLKSKLMQGIVAHMDEADAAAEPQDKTTLDQNKKLIEETNERIAANEDEQLELPKMIQKVNIELMMLTMDYTYDKMRTNTNEINEIAEWIAQVRVDLKKNIIKKQNREINNREIYSYMHDIFGPGVVALFDLTNGGGDIALVSKDSAGVSVEDEMKKVTEEGKKEKQKPFENFEA